MPSYPFECPHCQDTFDIVLSIKDYDATDTWDCLSCEGEITKKNRLMTMPSVTRVSYVDGTKRPGFAENREMLKLKQDSYNLKPEDRKEIKKEINTIASKGKK